MHAVDVLVVGVYLTAVVALGARLGGAHPTVRDYFLSGGRVPGWALVGSIVATETSTVTLISVPGFAFGGNLTFLQLAAGYIVGKIAVAVWLMPTFFRRDYVTAYQPLADRFGSAMGRTSATIFLATRSASDGFRLFGTGLVVAAVLATWSPAPAAAARWVPALEVSTTLVVVAVGLIGGATLVYTLWGGMRAVIWTDVAQLVVYVAGAVAAAVILLREIPGGWTEVLTRAREAGKLVLVDPSLDLTRSYTFWSGLVGGAFLTAGTHGTDQMFVQRYLCSGSARRAGRALVWSGILVFGQFALFLGIGVMLWVYYSAYAPGELAAVTVDGTIQTDRILPAFMMSHLPVGLRGLVVAAVIAAAMSTLSSSLNSSAASTVGDIYAPATAHAHSDRHYLLVSRWATVAWTGVQVTVALAAIGLSRRVVDEVLGIQSFSLGLLLGTYWLAATAVQGSRAPIAGVLAGLTILLGLRVTTAVSWQWYVLVGAAVTFGIGYLHGRLLPSRAPA